ncbi:MAG: fibronectin type III domain-containing protein [Acidobacteriia bacterium]|nr:fibronectin type III domain-containing protein [Terriglobia bacterium]
MSIRATKPNAAARPNFDLRGSIFVLFLLAGCGAPGEPQPPAPPIPAAVSDLAARQSGDGVTLTFTPPREAVDGERLAEPPALEIFRGGADAKSFRLVYTIPGALVETYVVQERVQFFDPLTPEDLRALPGGAVAYRVRARASKKKASADSNTATVRLFPVPERIARLEARVTEAAIELSWPAPERTSGGLPLPAVSGFRVYRGELDPASAEAAARDLAQAKWKSLLALLAPAPGNNFRDAQFAFGAAYVYVVRSVVLAEGNSLESPDSVPAVVTPQDTFPPAAPQGLVAIFIPGGAATGLQADLSWSLNLETDLAGYRVYRSDTEESRGRLMTPSLLPAPAFRDMSVEAGHRYWYTVTAVDRAGNESLRSSPAFVDVTPSAP